MLDTVYVFVCVCLFLDFYLFFYFFFLPALKVQQAKPISLLFKTG